MNAAIKMLSNKRDEVIDERKRVTEDIARLQAQLSECHLAAEKYEKYLADIGEALSQIDSSSRDVGHASAKRYGAR